jgi:hypothetical protein
VFEPDTPEAYLSSFLFHAKEPAHIVSEYHLKRKKTKSYNNNTWKDRREHEYRERSDERP